MFLIFLFLSTTRYYKYNLMDRSKESITCVFPISSYNSLFIVQAGLSSVWQRAGMIWAFGISKLSCSCRTPGWYHDMFTNASKIFVTKAKQSTICNQLFKKQYLCPSFGVNQTIPIGLNTLCAYFMPRQLSLLSSMSLKGHTGDQTWKRAFSGLLTV